MHNEIVRRRPDLARLLAGPWFMDRKGEVPAGKQGFFELPVFNYHKVGQAAPAWPGDYYLSSVAQQKHVNLLHPCSWDT